MTTRKSIRTNNMYSEKTSIAKKFIEELDSHGQNILIFVHKSIDGDCIGSACGLSEVLRSLGYESKVLICEDIPSYMDYLDFDGFILRADKEEISAPTLAIATDCAAGSRMGVAGDLFENCENKLIVDHHATVTNDGDNRWVVPSASSTSELMFYLCTEMSALKNVDYRKIITKKAAMFFLTGIITDTGRFSYSNTNPETLNVSSELMRLGGEIAPVMYNCYDRKKQCELKISGIACSTARFDLDGKIASTVVTGEMFDMCGAGRDDIAEVVSRLRDVEGVEVAIVLREAEDGKIRVNLRSNENFDSSEFASSYKGGGHKRAAGCTVEDRDINELREEMVEKAIKLLNE